jgi:hypothetical protein
MDCSFRMDRRCGHGPWFAPVSIALHRISSKAEEGAVFSVDSARFGSDSRRLC